MIAWNLTLPVLVRGFIADARARKRHQTKIAADLHRFGVKVLGNHGRARKVCGGDVVHECNYLPAGVTTWVSR